MKLALECRCDLLEMIQPFADFDWILANEVLGDDTYKDFYKKSKRFKFVDNSVNEAGSPCSMEDLVSAFEMVEGSYIVSPDFPGDSDKTIEFFKECVKTFGREQVVGVIQGEDYQKAFECLRAMKGGIVAIPYDLGCSKTDSPYHMAISRALFTTNIPMEDFPFIHLLGFNSIKEFTWYKNRPNIVSIDTGIPVLLGMQGLDIMDELESKEKPTFKLMSNHKVDNKTYTSICRNIALLRKEIN